MSFTVDPQVLTGIRDVTDEEVRFYEDNGWVMLRGLFDPELAAELRRIAGEVMSAPDSRNGWEQRPVSGSRFFGVGHDDDGVEPFRTIALSAEVGRVARRLINRVRLTDTPVPIRFAGDTLWRKQPGAWPTYYHQDSTLSTADRMGEFTLWIALDEVTPEMGSMRFFSGSHREGLLGVNDERAPDGRMARTATEDESMLGDLLTHYPKLAGLYELSSPFHYQAGDATVHKGYTIHGGPANRTDRERWSWVLNYTPADTRYLNGHYGLTTALRPLGDDVNPVVDRSEQPR